MAVRTIIAVVLIVLGLGGVLYGGFSFTREKKVVDLGPVEVTTHERNRLPVSPIVGGVLLVAGVVLLVVRGKAA